MDGKLEAKDVVIFFGLPVSNIGYIMDKMEKLKGSRASSKLVTRSDDCIVKRSQYCG